MSTFSVFRRNKKSFLGVLGVLTMLSFVFIPTLEQFNRNFISVDQTVLTSKFGKMSQGQLETIRQKQGAVYMVFDPNFRGLSDDIILTNWVKARLAEEMGLVVADSEIREFIGQRFESKEAYLEALRENKMGSSAFEEGLIDIILAEKYSQYQFYGQRSPYGIAFGSTIFPVTVQRQWNAFCKTHRTAALDVVPVTAESCLAKTAEPTEAEVKAFFEQYKNTLPAPENGTIGFKIPMKMTVNYFVYEMPKSESLPADLTPASTSMNDTAAEAPAAPAEAAPAAPAATATPVEAAPAAPAEAAPAAAPAEAAPVSEEVEINIDPNDIFDAEKFYKLVQSDIVTYSKKLMEVEDGSALELTFSDETNAYIQKFGIQFKKLEMVDGGALAEMPVGDALQLTSPYSEVSRRFASLKNFNCMQAEENGNQYIVWKSEVKGEEVPELTDEVKKTVVAAWKLEKAKDLAMSSAILQAKMAQESKKLENAKAVESFSFMLLDPGLYAGLLDNISQGFADEVYAMVPGDVKAIANADRSVSYIVMLKSYAPEDAELREQFLETSANPEFSRELQFMEARLAGEEIMELENSAFRDAEVKFMRQTAVEE